MAHKPCLFTILSPATMQADEVQSAKQSAGAAADATRLLHRVRMQVSQPYVSDILQVLTSMREVRSAIVQTEEAQQVEQKARADAEEAGLLRRVISQLPRPTMASRTETSITLSLARLIKSSGDDKVQAVLLHAQPMTCETGLLSKALDYCQLDWSWNAQRSSVLTQV